MYLYFTKNYVSQCSGSFCHFEEVIHKGKHFNSLAIKSYMIIKCEIFYHNIDVFKIPTNTTPNHIFFLGYGLDMVPNNNFFFTILIKNKIVVWNHIQTTIMPYHKNFKSPTNQTTIFISTNSK